MMDPYDAVSCFALYSFSFTLRLDKVARLAATC